MYISTGQTKKKTSNYNTQKKRKVNKKVPKIKRNINNKIWEILLDHMFLDPLTHRFMKSESQSKFSSDL